MPPAEHVRRRFSSQPVRDTTPELALRSVLHRRGFRYRVDRRPIPKLRRKADLVFASARLAVFVDGCFWHSCPTHRSLPKQNREWWARKLDANVVRDRDTSIRLREAGWTVVRVWEHEDAEDAADLIAAALGRIRA